VVDVTNGEDVADSSDGDVVGNADLRPNWNVRRASDVSDDQHVNLGFFKRDDQRRKLGMSMNGSDNHVASPLNSGTKDPDVLFIQKVDNHDSCCEIVLNVSSRDVHQTNRNGQKEWRLNEKPKRRAEVQFRHLNDQDKLDLLRAMQGEVGSYLENEAVAIASRHGVPSERVLGMRWVLTWKVIQNDQGETTGCKPKARLIIKGFQDPDLLNLRKDSPTLSTQSRNVLLSVSAMQLWTVQTGDIKTAFLNGDKTEYQRAIYAEPPEEVKGMLGMKSHEVFRILKAIYGLLHAPRCWYQKLDSVLVDQGWVKCRLEPCVWKLFQNGKLQGLVGGHVDDLLICGDLENQYFCQKIDLLRQAFPFGSWKNAQKESLTFCSCELVQKQDFSIELNQEKYADSISEINMTRERKQCQDSPLNDVEKKQFRVVLGGLAWRSTQTAPWLCASTSYLQGCFQSAIVGDALELNKLVRAQQHYSNTPLHFSSDVQKPMLVTFHDASWSNRRDLSSQGGMITVITSEDILSGKASSFSPVSWQSKRLPRVCRSSTAAEIQMASTAIDSHEFLKQLFLDLFNEQQISLSVLDDCLKQMKSLIVTDSKNMYDSVMKIESSGLQLEEKRLAVEVLSYRDRLGAAGVDCRWVDSDQQLADTLSKAFCYDAFLNLFQRRQISIFFDPSFLSAKKKRALRRKPRFLEVGDSILSEDS